jgi:hypothetical protein
MLEVFMSKAEDNAASPNACRLIEVLIKSFPTVPKRAINSMAKAVEEKLTGKSPPEIKSALREFFPKESDKNINDITDSITNTKRMDKIIEVPKFNIKRKFKNAEKQKEYEKEYARQIKGQEEGLNNLTIKKFFENRKAYKDRLEEEKKKGKKKPSGRDPKGSTQQQAMRDEALNEKMKELRRQGVSPKEAKEQAENWIENQAALHDPDQIAGGNPENVTGMGDRKVNNSIGSQWKTRADDFGDSVQQYVKDNNLADKDIEKIHLNVKLSCGGT